MPSGLGPRESLALVLLYQAGAHLEALTQALGLAKPNWPGAGCVACW